eukprot:9029026-Pyramimonas_sp.AAC.1
MYTRWPWACRVLNWCVPCWASVRVVVERLQGLSAWNRRHCRIDCCHAKNWVLLRSTAFPRELARTTARNSMQKANRHGD